MKKKGEKCLSVNRVLNRTEYYLILDVGLNVEYFLLGYC